MAGNYDAIIREGLLMGKSPEEIINSLNKAINKSKEDHKEEREAMLRKWIDEWGCCNDLHKNAASFEALWAREAHPDWDVEEVWAYAHFVLAMLRAFPQFEATISDPSLDPNKMDIGLMKFMIEYHNELDKLMKQEEKEKGKKKENERGNRDSAPPKARSVIPNKDASALLKEFLEELRL